MGDTHDFGNGPIPAHRHRNPDGSEGGWVADSARIGANVKIARSSTVGAWASVEDYVRIDNLVSVGNRTIIGYRARIYANTRIGADVLIGETARIGEGSIVATGVAVGAGARIRGSAWVATSQACASGDWGGYAWAIWWDVHRTLWLRYGCECQPIEWWHGADHEALSVHFTGKKDHAGVTRALVVLAESVPMPAGEPPEVKRG